MSVKKSSTVRNLKRVGSDMKKVDEYVLGPKDYEEIPELTEEWFKRATIHVGGAPVSRGRPPSPHPKEAVSLRLDQRRHRAFPPRRPRLAEPHQCGVAQGGQAAGGEEAEEGVNCGDCLPSPVVQSERRRRASKDL